MLILAHLKTDLRALKPKRGKGVDTRRYKQQRLFSWSPGVCYVEIKRATHLFRDATEIYNWFKQNKLTVSCFSQFCHCDPNVDRSQRIEPKYAAVFALQDGSFLLPQTKHYTQCYRNAGRTQFLHAYDILADQTPYWCCLYANRKARAKASKERSKRRHQNNNAQ